MSDYALFDALRIERDEEDPTILQIILDGPNLNAVSIDGHRQLADVWLAVDRDPSTKVAVLQGAGRGLSAGGSFEMIDQIIGDYSDRARIMREARDLVYNVINCSKPADLRSSLGGGG